MKYELSYLLQSYVNNIQIQMENIIQSFEEYSLQEPQFIVPKLNRFSRENSIILEDFQEQIQSKQLQSQQTKKQIEELEKQFIFQRFINAYPNDNRIRKNQMHIIHQLKKRLSNKQTKLIHNQSKKKLIQILANQKKLKKITQRQYLLIPICPTQTLQLIIKKNSQSLFQNPIYKLYNSSDNTFLMAAQKSFHILQTEYYITTNQKRVSQKQNKYLGKISSNFLSTQWIMYDDGFNPSKVRDLSQYRKQLMYIKYAKNIFGWNGPRKFNLYIPRLDQDLKAIIFRPYTDENIFQKYIKEQSNEILRYKNKDPIFNEDIKKYILKRQEKKKKKYNQKDFLIEDIDKKSEIEQFRVINENEYSLRIKHPLSIFQGFGIALSNIQNKMFVQ